MLEEIQHFLARLDVALLPFADAGERLDMYHLGRSALVLHYHFALTTADIDIVAVSQDGLYAKAVELFGFNTAQARELGLYLQLVPPAVPALPRWYRQRATLVPGEWKVLRLWRLDIHDFAATKLKCFRPKDRADLQALCDAG